MRKKSLAAALITVFASTLLISGCQSIPSNITTSITQNSLSQSDGKPIIQRGSHSIVSPLTLSELCEESQVIAIGTIEDESEPFYVQSQSGESVMLFTDHRFSIEQVIGGDSSLANTTVDVRTSGGKTGLVEATYDYEPDLQQGKRYLLFLCEQIGGESLNTPGTHYAVTNGQFGSYEVTADKLFTNPFSGDVLDLSTLADTASEHPPITAEERKEKLFALYDSYVEEGSMTEQEAQSAKDLLDQGSVAHEMNLAERVNYERGLVSKYDLQGVEILDNGTVLYND